MANISHGTASVNIPDFLSPPEKAGKMSPVEVTRIPKPPRGIGLACDQAADALGKDGEFMVPGVTADALRQAGSRAEQIDFLISDVEVILGTLKQANLLFDAEAWELLRKVNDQVKAQGKHDPAIRSKFAAVTAYFSRLKPLKKPEEEPEEEPEPTE